MHLSLAVVLCALMTQAQLTSAASVSIFSELDDRVETELVSRWAQAALSWLASSPACNSPACSSVRGRPTQHIRLLAGAAAGPVTVTFISGTDSATNHDAADIDAVLVLDSMPGRPFGHPLLVFGIHTHLPPEQCRNISGTSVGGGCLHALRPANCKREDCTVLFPPLVTPAGRTPHVSADVLQCRSDIPGFASADLAPCPNVRRRSGDAGVPLCDPLASNTPRCATATPPQARIRCTPGFSCDHAIIIYGRWSQQLNPSFNVDRVYDRLLQDGFAPENLATFVGGGDARRPPAHKMGLRSHIRRLCEQPRCIGALVMIVAGAATTDGSVLLWDADQNGRVSDSERYTPQELVKDLSRCQARRVFVMVDHAFAEPVVATANAVSPTGAGNPFSRHLKNVVIVSAAAHGPELAHVWLETHPETCMDTLVKASASVFQGSPGLLNTTAVGVPCTRRGKTNCSPLTTDVDVENDEVGDSLIP